MSRVTPMLESPNTPSLEGLNGSVPLPPVDAGFWKQWRAFVGPALLVSVGYMDPGNWGTDLQAGASFKYDLLWVVALSSAMAIIMQLLAARLGIVARKDLAQACRDFLPRWSRIPLWLFCEVAIGACDLAEVLGSAVALNLLFGIPLFWAVIITAFDVMLLLALQGLGMRFIEALILVLVGTIGACFFIEIFVLPQTHPNFVEMGRATLSPGFRQEGMILVAIGIIGATVMPHNLYLHSALVQTRQINGDDASVRRAIKFNSIDTVLALSIAFFVNAAILVLAATTFHGKDGVHLPTSQVVKYDDDTKRFVNPTTGAEIPENEVAGFTNEPDWLPVAHLTLAPLLGTALASTLFAIALLASGQSSTITGTMAGQIVMEGFMHWRVRPWVRRLITRMIAIVPAIVVIGAHERGGKTRVTDLLVLSQVVLAMQLPFAMFPLLYVTSVRKRMGRFRSGWFLLIAGWTTCILITALDIRGLPSMLREAGKVIAEVWTITKGR